MRDCVMDYQQVDGSFDEYGLEAKEFSVISAIPPGGNALEKCDTAKRQRIREIKEFSGDGSQFGMSLEMVV